MSKIDQDLEIALDSLFFKPDGGNLDASAKPLLERVVRERMKGVGGWILDQCEVTLHDEGEWIDVKVVSGKAEAIRSIRIEDPVTGEVAVRVDLDGDGE